jgi:hypothetical protein
MSLGSMFPPLVKLPGNGKTDLSTAFSWDGQAPGTIGDFSSNWIDGPSGFIFEVQGWQQRALSFGMRGLIAAMTVEAATVREIFLACLDEVLCPRLRSGDGL